MLRELILSAALVFSLTTGGVHASPADEVSSKVHVDGLTFESHQDLFSSDYFKAAGLRCGTMDRDLRQLLFGAPEFGVPADCSQTNTAPDGWDPDDHWEVQVVFHIIRPTTGTDGQVSLALINSQMEVFNEDFLAIMGTNGANGNDSRIRFVLASEDPLGSPTTGITETLNDTWFADSGNYWDTLAWDPNRYLNIYSNEASGALGYVPFLPADGGGSMVGSNADRVVILWNSIGRNAPIGPPFHLGRTVTHEVGHYLGLEHTFNNGCTDQTAPGCYMSGDLICDTNPHASPTSGCPGGATSCAGNPLTPIDNYMNYSSDDCMEKFTPEQVNRMRCSMFHYRSNLFQIVNDSEIFADGFESGDTTAW